MHQPKEGTLRRPNSQKTAPTKRLSLPEASYINWIWLWKSPDFLEFPKYRLLRELNIFSVSVKLKDSKIQFF